MDFNDLTILSINLLDACKQVVGAGIFTRVKLYFTTKTQRHKEVVNTLAADCYSVNPLINQ
jgi:hypothetical protein